MQLKTNMDGSLTLFVEYQGNDTDDAVNLALASYGLQEQAVQLILIPESASSWLWPADGKP